MQAASRTGKVKVSEYGKQLLEKQKVAFMFGLNDRQLRSVFALASKTVGQTDSMMHSLLERRLDNSVFRAGFATTRIQSRQFVSHGMFTVNGVRVTIPSYRVKKGDIVKVRDKKKASPVFPAILAQHEKYIAPSWIKADPSTISFTVNDVPLLDEHFEKGVDMRKVIGFYSR